MESDLEDVLPLSPELRSEMERWLPEYERSVRRDHRRGLLPSDYLTQSYMPTGTPPGMTLVDGKRRQNGRSGVINPGHPAARSYEVVTAGLRRLGLPDQNQGIHTLRRSAARQIFDALVETRRYDGALRVVQSLLHHSTRETTDEYIGLSSEALTRDEFLRTAILLGEPERPALASVSPGPQGLPRSDSRQELAWGPGTTNSHQPQGDGWPHPAGPRRTRQ